MTRFPLHAAFDGGVRPRAPAGLRVTGPSRVGACALVMALVATAHAQPAGGGDGKDKPATAPAASSKPAAGAGVLPGKPPPVGKPKVFDFTGLDISGRLRTPQLLYFLDRATEELERASLERRSFIPEMVRSVDEGPL